MLKIIRKNDIGHDVTARVRKEDRNGRWGRDVILKDEEDGECIVVFGEDVRRLRDFLSKALGNESDSSKLEDSPCEPERDS